MNSSDTPWHITAFRVPSECVDETLDEVRALRAEILYDHGRRPAFRDPDGSYADSQDLDAGAWHFVAREKPDGPPLGYIRLSTPATGDLFQSLAFLGRPAYQKVLAAEGVTAAETFEHSRLVVAHRARKLGLGVHLNAVAIGAAHSLGATMMIGTSGTRDGQDRFHERFGFRAVPGTRRYVPHYTEDVVIMTHRAAEGAAEYTGLVDRFCRSFPDLSRSTAPTVRAPAAPAPPGLRDGPAAGRESWQPELFEPAGPDDRARLSELLASGVVRDVHDTLDTQLDELIRSREPSAPSDPDTLRRKRDEQLAGTPSWMYGTWAWYPWSARLVHLLPRAEFRLVRTDRNRGRIERPDQRSLFGRRIGVVGLSVGNSAAVTLALEGVGGAYKLADFDDYSLSNLNRLRAGVHDLGSNKAVLCARQMAEIDPYLDIEIFPAGLTDAGITDFFLGGNGPIDLLVEECDTPYVKIAAREQARALGVPVVMDCNDRGMLDVERFDHEPDRPVLHGRLGGLKSDDVHDLSRSDQVELILSMVDAGRISPELAASFDQVGTTLSSWPQLASGVALGGALVTEAARRILLGQPCDSGRFYVDLDELITPGCNTAELSGAVSGAVFGART